MSVQYPGRVFQISSDGDDRRIFWVGKFGRYFLGWLVLRRDSLGIQNNLKIRGSARVSRSRSSANKVQSNLFCFL